MDPNKSNTLRSDILTIPNILSLFRILLVPVFLWAVFQRKASAALLIFVLASLTDLLDGFTARVWHQRSKLGTVLDPAGDKLLLTASYVVLTFPSLAAPNCIPLWLTATVFARDLLIVTGALIAFLSWKQGAFTPSILGKLSTVCQIGTIFLVLWLNHLHITARYMSWVYVISLAATLASGIHYLVYGLATLRRHRTPPRAAVPPTSRRG